MMRSLYSGVSGLKNHQTRMDVIGNNISNVNTTGFKSGRVTFADTLSQNLSGAAAPQGGQGGTNPKQIGLGSVVSSIDTIFTDSSPQTTGVNTDLCLSGNGLFIVSSSKGTYYTRNGNFRFDKEGNYVNADGYFVQGWMAAKPGEAINTLTEPGKITIPAGKSMAGEASSVSKFTQNLNSEEPLIKGMSLTLADGRVVASPVTGTSFKIGDSYQPKVSSVTLTLTDGATPPTLTTVTESSGGPYVLGGNYGTGTPPLKIDAMTVAVDDGTTLSVPAGSTTGYTIGDPYGTSSDIESITLKLADGTTTTETSGAYTIDHSRPLTTVMTVYDSLGGAHEITVYLTKTSVSSTTGNQWTASINLDGTGIQTIDEQDGTTTTVTMKDQIIQFNVNGGYDTGGIAATLELNNGAGTNQSVKMDFTGLTQYASSNTAFASADGHAPGTLKSVSIDAAGVITGTYTNGLNIQEGQVAIAQFNNAAGLTKVGNSLYTESNNSGVPNVGTINGLGCEVIPSALEMSNVDMANELTDMIVTQRGFQSNSKIITVSDELLETLINMKR